MGYCRARWTLVDNEATELDLVQLGALFKITIQGITYFGIADNSDPAIPTTIKCKLFSNEARDQEVISGIPVAVPYTVEFFAGWTHLPPDNGFKSNDLEVRVDTGLFIGHWEAIPRETEGEFDFEFIGVFQAFGLQVLNVTVQDNGAGNLAAGTYSYCITAVDSTGREGAASADAQITVGANGNILIDWPTVTDAISYNVYRQDGFIGSVSAPTTQFIDDGTIVPDGSHIPPLVPDPGIPAPPPVPIDSGTADSTFQPDPVLGTPNVNNPVITKETFDIDPETGAIITTQTGSIEVQTDIGTFTIPNIVSGVSVKDGVIIDPSIVDSANLPVGDISTTLTVTTVIDADTITITEINSFSQRITTLSITIATGAFILAIEFPDGTFTNIPGVIDNVTELLAILRAGTLTITTILDNFRLTADKILADEKIIINVVDEDPTFVASGETAIYVPDRNGRLYKSTDGGLTFTLINSNVLFASQVPVIIGATNNFAVGQGWFIQRAADTWQTSGTPKFYVTNNEASTWTAINGNAFTTIPIGSIHMKMQSHGGIPMGLMIDPDGIIRIYPTLGIFVVDSYAGYTTGDSVDSKFGGNLTALFGDDHIYGLMQRVSDNVNVIIRRQLPANPADPLGAVEELHFPTNDAFIPGLDNSFLAIPGKMAYVYQRTDNNAYRAVSTDGTTWIETNLGQATLYAGPEQDFIQPNRAEYFVEGIGVVAALSNVLWSSADLEIWASVAFAGLPFDELESLNPYAGVSSTGSHFYYINEDGEETVLDAGFNALRLQQPTTFISPTLAAEVRHLRRGVSVQPATRPPFNPSISIALPKGPLAKPPIPTTPSFPIASKVRHQPRDDAAAIRLGTRSANAARFMGGPGFYTSPFLVTKRAVPALPDGRIIVPALSEPIAPESRQEGFTDLGSTP